MSSLSNIVAKYQLTEHNCHMVNKSSRSYHFAFSLCIAVYGIKAICGYCL